MPMQKRKTVKRKRTPDAFDKRWPEIKPSEKRSALELIRPTENYEMGQLHVSVSPGVNGMPAIMQVNHPHRLPTWDEMVWLRYQLMPDVVDIALILPPLDEYINYDSGRSKNTMTMEEVHRVK